MYNHKMYFIETLTNTHVGSGATNFGVVDNLIQKDPTTHLPVFNASSVKGALRDHFRDLKKIDKTLNIDMVGIFGSENQKENSEVENGDKEIKGKKDNNDTSAGSVRFYEARLLTIPLRSNNKVFYHATSINTILDFLQYLLTFKVENEKVDLVEVESLKEKINGLEIKKDFLVFHNAILNLVIEDYEQAEHNNTILTETEKTIFKKYISKIENTAIFEETIFQRICKQGLPVIARNSLKEDGESDNLWYEEVLPRKSKLWFMIGYPILNPKNISTREFEKHLTTDLIQFGANHSIGYGVTKISEVGGSK